MTTTHYDEFGLFQENAEEFGIALREPPDGANAWPSTWVRQAS